ncbi:MAG: type II secretion system-associated lipoprotein [Turneriella sp.]
MRRTSIVLVTSLALVLFACGSRFIKKEEIQRISKNYEGVYVLRERVETGNFDSLNKGARVKIFFKAAGDYVSIYAYPYSQPREEAVGKNILQLFESDFPDKKFSEEVLRQRISDLVEEYKGKPDAPVKPAKAAKPAGRK